MHCSGLSTITHMQVKADWITNHWPGHCEKPDLARAVVYAPHTTRADSTLSHLDAAREGRRPGGGVLDLPDREPRARPVVAQVEPLAVDDGMQRARGRVHRTRRLLPNHTRRAAARHTPRRASSAGSLDVELVVCKVEMRVRCGRHLPTL